MTDAPTRVPATTPPNPTPSRWLSDVIDEYTRHLRRKAKLSENTIVYTLAPSLRLFRELLSDSRRTDLADGAHGADAAPGAWDMRLHEITPARIGAFIETFWKFPTRQGKRPDSADAKAVLAEGGEAQSRENTAKRLRHIHASRQDRQGQALAHPVYFHYSLIVELIDQLSVQTARPR